MASYVLSKRISVLGSVVDKFFTRRVEPIAIVVIGPNTVAQNSWNRNSFHTTNSRRPTITRLQHLLLRLPLLPATTCQMSDTDDVRIRDFQPSRSRSATQAAPNNPRLSFETASPGPGRHNTLNSPNIDRGRSFSRTSSLEDGMSVLNKRPTRQNTVRNYHSPSRPTWEEPGAEPGIDTTKESEPHFGHLMQECQITVVDFSDERMSKYELDNEELVEFLKDPREEWVGCRWINVNGLSWDVIKELGNKYNLHRLAIEDLMNTRGRTKADWYSDHAFSRYLSFSFVTSCEGFAGTRLYREQTPKTFPLKLLFVHSVEVLQQRCTLEHSSWIVTGENTFLRPETMSTIPTICSESFPVISAHNRSRRLMLVLSWQ